MSATVTLTLARSVYDNTTDRTETITWEEFASLPHDRRPDKERGGDEQDLGFSPAIFAPGACACGVAPTDANGKRKAGCPDYQLAPGARARGHRKETNVIAVTALGLDLDKNEDQSELTIENAARFRSALRASGCAHVVYSSHSYAPPTKNNLRVFVQLSRPVTRDEWRRGFYAAALKHLGVPSGLGDKPDARRFWYAPSAPEGAPVVSESVPGAPLDVDAILASLPVPPATVPRESTLTIAGALTLDTALAAWCPDAQIYQCGGERRAKVECPNAGAHTDGVRDAMVFEMPDGKLGFRCLHAHCDKLDWHAFRHHYEPDHISPTERAGITAAVRTVNATPETATTKSVTESEPGTFAAELARALSDVKTALDSTRVAAGEEMPLFERGLDLIGRAFPEDPWLVRSLVKRGGTLIVSGEPKTTKTWSLTEIAMAVATGTKAFGEFATGAPLRVGYFFAEDLGADVRAHLIALAAGRNMAPERAVENMIIQPRGRFLDVLRDEDLALIVASVRHFGGVDLLCLEPLRDLHSGEEDKSDSMRDVMRRLRLLGELLTCTLAAAHHAGKSGGDTKGRRGGQRMRGSGAIHGAIDSGLYLSGLSGNGETEFVNDVESEVKGARGGGSFELALRIVDGADHRAIKATWQVTRREHSSAGKAADADVDHARMSQIIETIAIAEIKHEPTTETALLRKVRGGKAVFTAAIREAMKRGLVEAHLRGKKHCGWKLTAAGRKFNEGAPSLADAPPTIATPLLVRSAS